MKREKGSSGASAQIIDAAGRNTGQGGAADLDGNYSTGPLSAGKYDIEYTSIGYQTQIDQGSSGLCR
jgi:hypothetical protein